MVETGNEVYFFSRLYLEDLPINRVFAVQGILDLDCLPFYQQEAIKDPALAADTRDFRSEPAEPGERRPPFDEESKPPRPRKAEATHCKQICCCRLSLLP